MVETLGRGALVLTALGLAYLVAMWFVLIVWTFRDIEARSRSVVTQVFSTLMAVLFFVPGVLLYLILRPKVTLDEAFQRSLEEEYLLQDLEELPLCSNCHRFVEDDFVLCPHCHSQLREPCGSCSRLVDLRWPLCPYCSTVQHGRTTATERVEAPAARWTSPELRRRRALEGLAGAPTAPSIAATSGVPETAQVPAAPSTDEAEDSVQPAPQKRPASIAFVEGMRALVRPFEHHQENKTPHAAENDRSNGSDGGSAGDDLGGHRSLRSAVDFVEQSSNGRSTPDAPSQNQAADDQRAADAVTPTRNGYVRSADSASTNTSVPSDVAAERPQKPRK